MNTIVLQIPIRKDIRDQAASTATKLGFSSLQETVRVFLKQLAAEEMQVTFASKSMMLSAKNDARYAKMIDEVKSGKMQTKKFTSVQTLMDHLSR